MDLLSVSLIGVGLSADAVAVALSCGLAIKHLTLNKPIKIALYFGGFQGLMPLIGWIAGVSISWLIEPVDHWIAFGLLALIGGKMIHEALGDDDCEDAKPCPTQTKTLLVLAIATSIDALAVGISLATLQVDILKASGLIGVITFTLCWLSVFIGHRFGTWLGSKLEVVGGVILIGIGIKILTEHLMPTVATLG